MYVPARVGGVDLSSAALLYLWMIAVPARVGGVDLSIFSVSSSVMACSPRPCGRGGFKPYYKDTKIQDIESPPVWAGWI